MKIPSKVKVGGIWYKVIIAEHWFEHESADGETFYDNVNGNTIYIRKSLSQEAKEVTFLHEVIHCMNATINHEFIDSFAEQMYQFLSDNKLLK